MMCPSVKLDDMPHGTSKSDMSGYAAKLDELERKLDRERQAAVEKCAEMYERIKLLEDERERNVLVYHYINGESWDDIALIMDYKVRWILQIHSDALFNFNIDLINNAL